VGAFGLDGLEVGALGVDAGVTRVIAGAARGRRLAVPAGRLTRPTSDRAREGLFSTLAALHGPLDGAGLLDLYAGSGAVGLEALSRGARRVLFVEADARAARVIRGNIAAIGLAGAELVTDRVERLLSRGPAGPGRYDLAVADPPYAVTDEEVSGVLAALATGGWLVPEAVVAVERATRSGPVSWPAGYTPDRFRRYGDTTFWYGLAAGTQSTAELTELP
jgi:16S rRNA (guanine966-N2)-methyltransferase